MEDENKDLSTSQDTQGNESDDQQQNDPQDGDDELALLKAENEKLKKAKSDQELRAKIAENKLKKEGQTQSQPKKEDLTVNDAYVLLKSNIHEDDLEYVKKFAKMDGLSLADAIKNDELKAVLKVREEKRKTSEATSVGRTPRGTSQVSDEVILEKASKGHIPDAGSKEAEALFWARRGGRR